MSIVKWYAKSLFSATYKWRINQKSLLNNEDIHKTRKRFCLLVCLLAVSHLSRDHHYRRRASNFVIYSALMSIEQWEFLSVPHLLWHGSSVYNCHIWGPMTLTPIVEHLAEELSLPDLTHRYVSTVDLTPISLMRGERCTFGS